MEGENVGTLSHAANHTGSGSSPWHVEVDSAGRVYVADPKAGCVAMYSRTWEYQETLGSRESEETLGSRLREPVAVEVDRHGVIYVADRASKKVHMYDSKLEYVGALEGVEDPQAIGLYRCAG